ncbi:3-deoxy-manno-octulosonate cytidylyltransferase [Halotalea alkalilenta]|uniref:3-deoxy-manno-octulosonate cytidylyltransferase n=1 Tax=Halotalea alkalilenta TaxID=376489 RepID=A0A172YFQ7_9GAMM|nr:3-deoxy-manno-octulosonate cytidylyltransferase [Halotalea alkalilenta]ANF57946.1 3-deoxy-manno-octulosonate cytidylyltransferase [Halotalea alkalilenta]
MDEPLFERGFWVVIPARFASARLPGKPLVEIAGMPMIEHVWRRACASSAHRVVIATDDERIERVARDFGAEVMLTSPDHENGTSRLAEVAERFELPADTRVVNVQGDEPLLPSTLIDLVAESLLANPEASIATLAEPISDPETLARASVVKVVRDQLGRALYFSRAPIPWQRESWGDEGPGSLDSLPTPARFDAGWLRHIGLYGYRVGFLQRYAGWPPAPIEQLEQLEQLRALYYGHRIQVEVTPVEYPAGIDTPEDLARVRRLLEGR